MVVANATHHRTPLLPLAPPIGVTDRHLAPLSFLACPLQPISGFVRGSDGARMTLQFDPSNTSSLVARLTKALSDIQYGRTPHEWSVPFE